MRYQIAHRGTPIGQAQFTPVGLAIADFEPYLAYEDVRDVIRQASEYIWRIGVFGGRDAKPSRVPQEVFARVAALSFEIRDAFGELVDADWVNVIERPEPAAAPVLVARFRSTGDRFA